MTYFVTHFLWQIACQIFSSIWAIYFSRFKRNWGRFYDRLCNTFLTYLLQILLTNLVIAFFTHFVEVLVTDFVTDFPILLSVVKFFTLFLRTSTKLSPSWFLLHVRITKVWSNHNVVISDLGIYWKPWVLCLGQSVQTGLRCQF